MKSKLSVRNFANLQKVDITFGDLTVLVGPQGSSKSLVLQLLKAAIDGKNLVNALRTAGHEVGQLDVLVDSIFGSGMSKAWNHETEVKFCSRKITPQDLPKIGKEKERVCFIPGQRSLLISNGLAPSFQELSSDIPAAVRTFSQKLFEQLSKKDVGKLLNGGKQLKEDVQKKIDETILRGWSVEIGENAQHTRQIYLVKNNIRLPFMAWTAGQCEFIPVLLGLDNLKDTNWIVLEEPEMGLHPEAVNSAMLLVIDLICRGYKVVVSTHSPVVLTMLWMIRQLKEHNARPELICEALGISKSSEMKDMAKEALRKDYRVYLMQPTNGRKVESVDISELDPGSEDERIAGWGGLTEYASRFGNAVCSAVNEAH